VTDQFRRLWALGYKLLVPIVPPGAPISERSTLFKRLNTPQDGRGKIPGIKGRDGNWFGIDLTTCVADEHDLDRWNAMGAGVGIRTGQQPDGTWLVAIDADTLNVEHAKTIRDAIDGRLGRLPIRVGNHPKALYVARLDGPLPYQRIEFGTERVEVLSDGRQFVAEGIHPITGKPYSWPRPLVPFAELPVFKVTP